MAMEMGRGSAMEMPIAIEPIERAKPVHLNSRMRFPTRHPTPNTKHPTSAMIKLRAVEIGARWRISSVMV